MVHTLVTYSYIHAVTGNEITVRTIINSRHALKLKHINAFFNDNNYHIPIKIINCSKI